jgi:hypothetical protein
MPAVVKQIVLVLASLGFLFVLVEMVYIFLKRETTPFKRAAPKQLLLSLVGCLVLLVAVMVLTLPNTPLICALPQLLTHLGSILIILPVFMKQYRLNHIFGGFALKVQTHTDERLFVFILLPTLFFYFLFAVLQLALTPYSAVLTESSSDLTCQLFGDLFYLFSVPIAVIEICSYGAGLLYVYKNRYLVPLEYRDFMMTNLLCGAKLFTTLPNVFVISLLLPRSVIVSTRAFCALFMTVVGALSIFYGPATANAKADLTSGGSLNIEMTEIKDSTRSRRSAVSVTDLQAEKNKLLIEYKDRAKACDAIDKELEILRSEQHQLQNKIAKNMSKIRSRYFLLGEILMEAQPHTNASSYTAEVLASL